MTILNKKKYVSPVNVARQKVSTAVAAFATLSADLTDASATLSAEAEADRQYAADLIANAQVLETEATVSLKIAAKLGDFLS